MQKKFVFAEKTIDPNLVVDILVTEQNAISSNTQRKKLMGDCCVRPQFIGNLLAPLSFNANNF